MRLPYLSYMQYLHGEKALFSLVVIVLDNNKKTGQRHPAFALEIAQYNYNMAQSRSRAWIMRTSGNTSFLFQRAHSSITAFNVSQPLKRAQHYSLIT